MAGNSVSDYKPYWNQSAPNILIAKFSDEDSSVQQLQGSPMDDNVTFDHHPPNYDVSTSGKEN